MRRTIVVCDRPEVGDVLRTELERTGHVVEVIPPADVLPHQLDDAHCVIAVDDASAATELLARLRGNTRVSIVLPTMSLPAAIEWLSASPRVVAVSASAVDASALALDGEPVTIDHVLGPGTAVTHVVTDDLARRTLLAQLAQHAAQVGVPTQLQHAIEQACDELVTNALYAAPVDADGKPLFGELSTTDRLRYRTDAAVTARFGRNEHLFALSVRDEYGSLQRVTALAYMHKGIHATSKVEQRISGAGLGLYLIATECAAMHIFIENGVATELVCVFDVRAERQQLRRLTMVSIDGDAEVVAARARSRSSVLRPARGGGATRTWIVGGALATVAVAIAGVVAWRMSRSTDDTFSLGITTEPPGATVTVDGRVASGSQVAGLRNGAPVVITADRAGYVGKRFVVTPRPGTPLVVALQPQPPALDIDSTPSGATVLLDGTSVGRTPLVVTDVPAGREVTVTLQREGFAPTTARAVVPAAGKRAEVREQLSPAPDYALVHIDSSPPGARVIEKSLGNGPIFTPADVVVTAAEPHQFSLVMPRHLPAALPAFKPDGSPRTVVLEAVPVIQIETDRAGTATVIGVAHCAMLELPAECPVRAGTYEVEIRTAGQPAVRRTAMVGDQDIVIRY